MPCEQVQAGASVKRPCLDRRQMPRPLVCLVGIPGDRANEIILYRSYLGTISLPRRLWKARRAAQHGYGSRGSRLHVSRSWLSRGSFCWDLGYPLTMLRTNLEQCCPFVRNDAIDELDLSNGHDSDTTNHHDSH